jgi:hypothetical protein
VTAVNKIGLFGLYSAHVWEKPDESDTIKKEKPYKPDTIKKDQRLIKSYLTAI